MSTTYAVRDSATMLRRNLRHVRRYPALTAALVLRRPAVLAGHVLGAVLQSLLSVAAVLAVAVPVGFRPSATPLDWLAALGLLTLVSLALSWLSVAFGLVAKTVAGASNLPLPPMLLPFLGSGFVPTGSMPAGLRWFAEYQPFTPINETLRGLLTGTPVGTGGLAAVAWSAGITLLGYRWARSRYDRLPAR